MKNNIYFLIGLLLLLLLLFSPLSIQAISEEDFSPACHDQIASTVNDPSYPKGCQPFGGSQNATCCSSTKKIDNTNLVSFFDNLGYPVLITWKVLCPQKTVSFQLLPGDDCYAEANTLCGRVNTKSTTCSLPQNSACCATNTNLPTPIPTPTPTPVSTCPNNCSDHGFCSSSDGCICDYGWTGSDCATPNTATTIPCPNNCSDHGFCSSSDGCICDYGWTGSDCSVTTSATITAEEKEAIQLIATALVNIIDLDDQALQEIKDEDHSSKDYIPLLTLLSIAIQSLIDARDSLETDPDLEQLREDEPRALSKIDRSLKSSINKHKRASKTVEQIINNPKVNEDESFLSRLLKKTKKYLTNGRGLVQSTVIIVTSVRG